MQRGDNLPRIADSQYKDAGKWTAFHSANLDKIGENANSIRIGMKLRLRESGRDAEIVQRPWRSSRIS